MLIKYILVKLSTQFSGIYKSNDSWSSRLGAAETNPTGNHEVACSIPDVAQRVKDPEWP